MKKEREREREEEGKKNTNYLKTEKRFNLIENENAK